MHGIVAALVLRREGELGAINGSLSEDWPVLVDDGCAESDFTKRRRSGSAFLQKGQL